MNTKKFLFILTLFTVAAFVTFPLLTSAQPTSVSNITSVNSVVSLLKEALKVLRAIFFALAAIFIVLAAWNYLTAQGDPTKVSAAKTMLIYTAVAIAIALIAGSFQSIIINFLQRA